MEFRDSYSNKASSLEWAYKPAGFFFIQLFWLQQHTGTMLSSVMHSHGFYFAHGPLKHLKEA